MKKFIKGVKEFAKFCFEYSTYAEDEEFESCPSLGGDGRACASCLQHDDCMTHFENKG